MTAMPQFTTSISAYVGINPTGITANLAPLGTSIITSGRDKNLTMDPGSYSVDPDAASLNASVSDQVEKHEKQPRSSTGMVLSILLSTVRLVSTNSIHTTAID